MKKLPVLLLYVLLASVAANAAETFSYKPTPSDLGNLDHYKAFKWTVGLGFDTDEKPISEATLTIKNIRNWQREPNVLYIRLLDASPSSSVGVRTYTDNQGWTDYFAGKGLLIDAWTDSYYRGTDLVYSFNTAKLAALNQYGADRRIAFGFDPDCHYYNCGIKFDVVCGANVIPAPGAILLAGIGTTLVGWLRRRKMM